MMEITYTYDGDNNKHKYDGDNNDTDMMEITTNRHNGDNYKTYKLLSIYNISLLLEIKFNSHSHLFAFQLFISIDSHLGT